MALSGIVMSGNLSNASYVLYTDISILVLIHLTPSNSAHHGLDIIYVYILHLAQKLIQNFQANRLTNAT